MGCFARGGGIALRGCWSRGTGSEGSATSREYSAAAAEPAVASSAAAGSSVAPSMVSEGRRSLERYRGYFGKFLRALIKPARGLQVARYTVLGQSLHTGC